MFLQLRCVYNAYILIAFSHKAAYIHSQDLSEDFMRLAPKKIPSLKYKLIRLNNEIDILYGKYHRWYFHGDLDDLERCVLILEDRRFFSHSGVDVVSVLREFVRLITFRKFGGASTIEMQFIRTINNRKELTAYRKMREMIVAYFVNYHFNKKAVLRSYLDIAFFGSGMIGRDAAADALFGKGISQLSLDEAAFLAAMLVYPCPLDRNDPWRARVQRRAKYALTLYPRFKKRFDQIDVAEIGSI